ncbi:hypothetical protein evm_011202 [Chilo suppressalis]|nr:hypothetical protein evm_011202 [Chilo suppressalis]
MMTKYKLNNTVRSASEVTLTSYMTGSMDSRKDERHYQIPELDTNQNDNANTESNRNLDASRTCNVCPHSCEFLHQSGKFAASLVKEECGKFGLNELKVEGLEKNVCLCEKYNGGCKLCPRPSLAPTLNLSLDGKESCLSCHDSTCATHFNHTNGYGGGGFPEKEQGGGSGSGISWRQLAARRARACCSTKMLLRRVPILAWLPQYSIRSGLADIIAGITVGLTVIPQAIAYAGVAGLPPQYGLYSSFMACFVYTVFGSVKDSAIGPTAIAAILTRENLHGLGPEFAVLLAFLSGCVELIMGILQLGFLIDFISGPVSVGFTSAAAIIIATTQVKDILGLSFPGGKFLQVWTGLYEHIGETRLWDAVLGVSCIVVLLLLRKVKDIKVGSVGPEAGERARRVRGCVSQALWFLATTRNILVVSVVSQALWFLATTRNILVVLVCAALAYYFDTQQKAPFVLTGVSVVSQACGSCPHAQHPGWCWLRALAYIRTAPSEGALVLTGIGRVAALWFLATRAHLVVLVCAALAYYFDRSRRALRTQRIGRVAGAVVPGHHAQHPGGAGVRRAGILLRHAAEGAFVLTGIGRVAGAVVPGHRATSWCAGVRRAGILLRQQQKAPSYSTGIGRVAGAVVPGHHAQHPGGAGVRRAGILLRHAAEGPSYSQVSSCRGVWFLATTRNILVVLVCAALAYYFDTQQKAPFVLTGIGRVAGAVVPGHTRNIWWCWCARAGIYFDTQQRRPSYSQVSVVSQALWFLATTRNILVVLVCAALAYYFDTQQGALRTHRYGRVAGAVVPGHTRNIWWCAVCAALAYYSTRAAKAPSYSQVWSCRRRCGSWHHAQHPGGAGVPRLDNYFDTQQKASSYSQGYRFVMWAIIYAK